MKKIKVILDFDGTLTDESKQAEELAVKAKKMLANEILGAPIEEIDSLYEFIKKEILRYPHNYQWEVNGLPATYAHEGAYLLNTTILQQIIKFKKSFLKKVQRFFAQDSLDPVTRCSNHLFHTCTLNINPHFLDGAREFIIWMIEQETIEPVILSNSETRKIGKNLEKIGIGEKGTGHGFDYEIEILGDTRQYHMDSNWDQHFEDGINGSIQVLQVKWHFSIDLRRPVYYAALKKVMDQDYADVVVVADGLSLAGALPLMMGLKFILKETDYTPKWSSQFVARHPNGRVVESLGELREKLISLVR